MRPFGSAGAETPERANPPLELPQPGITSGETLMHRSHYSADSAPVQSVAIREVSTTSPPRMARRSFGFLEGGGKVGALMRAHDCSRSPLGPPDLWPQSLRTVVALLLHSQFPMFVAWGDALGFLYNDAAAARA
jgi:hypothetical protein